MNTTISSEDIKNLSQNLCAETKISTVQKISAYYNGNNLTPKGIKLAEDIFKILAHDVEIKVREILSESLKNSHNIPQDIIDSLINDQDSVAIPFIKCYDSFTRSDLLRILELPNINKQKAVAQRINLSEDISQYIVDRCPEEVVGALILNNSAPIPDKAYDTIVSKYKDSENIKTCLVYRQELPIAVIEKIVNTLSQELKRRLITTHNLPTNLASDIVEQVKEKATLKISEDFSSDKQIEELVHQLYTANRLSPSLVVRSICLGDLKFFEYALVYLSNTPITEIRKILFSSSMDFMVRNLLRKAYIPKSMFPAVFSALEVLREIRFDIQENDRQNFSHRVIERILSLSGANDEFKEEDVKYLISKIS